MLLHIIAFIFLIIILLGYFKLADQFNIIDKPNYRSSHSSVTIRGGGIVFPAAAVLWFVMYGFGSPWFVLALLIMASVSFIDDVVTLSSKIRILFHFVAVSLLLWQLKVFGLPWYGIVLAYLFTIGWINAFNFMDGINGITAFYGLVSLITFGWLNRSIGFVSQHLIELLILSVIIFTFFNARKRAKTFAGDVGSVTMAFLLAWFMISLIIKTGQIAYILFFAVYGIETVFTIFFRLLKRENIFEAHRTHLYQYLSNEIKWSHILVACIFSSLQLVINLTTIFLITQERMTLTVFVLILIVLSMVYLIVRYKTIASIQP